MKDLITKFNEEEAKIYYESDNHINCDKEIERLNKEIIGLNKCITEFHSEFCYKQAEINRLNNIINELEKYLNKVIETSTEQEKITCSFVLQYLQELKGE